MCEMNLINLIVKASQHIIISNPSNMEPVAYGTGCIVNFKNRLFLLSVSHVTNVDKMATCLETNLPQKDLQSPLYSVGSLCYFNQYHIPTASKEQEIKKFEELNSIFDETLDVTFCEVKENISLLQPELNFGEFKVDAGEKVYLNFDEAGFPEKDNSFGFFGITKQKFTGAALKCLPKLEIGLKYQGTFGRFHLFNVLDVITNAEDFEGCSGAPILNDNGKLVGLLSSVNPETKSIFAFSIEECKKLLELSIESGLL